MATRSTISVLHDDGTVSSVYCHFDGYPSHNGKILTSHWNTQERAEALIKHGSMSGLGNNLDECMFYHRDRGESMANNRARVFQSETGWQNLGLTEEYNYLFRGGEWVVRRG